jgi:hypothetical protein
MRIFKLEQLLYRLDSVDVAARYLDKISALGVDPKGANISAHNLDTSHPECFLKGYSLSNPVMIRSYNSRDLLVNSNLV